MNNPNLVYEYDGSFQGYLNAVERAVGPGNSVGATIPIRARGKSDIFSEILDPGGTAETARDFWRKLAREYGRETPQRIFEAFCSDFPDKEDKLCAIVALLLRKGKKALDELGNPDAVFLEKASHRASFQAHIYTGLVRFRELADGSWYSDIEPECDVLPLVRHHFAARYPAMRFIIHDIGRGTAILHPPGGSADLVEGFSIQTADGKLPISRGEEELRENWKYYFRSVAIAGRTNPKLQAAHMPKKRWKFLPEMN
jgi:probable DNA metabolism protein